MQTAVIAPSSVLPRYATTGYHLCLCHKIIEDPVYAKFYSRSFGRSTGPDDFIILDNSAHELGEGLSSAMKDAAELVMPNEVVLPDRLFNAYDTIDFAYDRFEEFKSLAPTVMGVPQGTTIGEWEECCRKLVSLGVDTIGISKDYEAWEGGLLGLVYLVRKIAATTWMPKLTAIHLLGWGRQLWQLKGLAAAAVQPNQIPIRGVDSGKPIVYAINKIDLSKGFQRYPKRHLNFFDTPEQYIPEDIADANI